MSHNFLIILFFIHCIGFGVILGRRITKSRHAPYFGACLGAIFACGVMFWAVNQSDRCYNQSSTDYLCDYHS